MSKSYGILMVGGKNSRTRFVITRQKKSWFAK